MTSLRLENVCYERDDRIFFADLSFEVFPKQLLHIKGMNGIGKTTLLRIIAGLLSATRGKIFWNNLPLQQSGESYYAELSYIGHKNGITPQLTPFENLKYHMNLQTGLVDYEIIYSALNYFNLDNYYRISAGNLSAGQKKRLALARLLITKSKLWLLDEPLASLDSEGITLLKQIILNHLKNKGMLIMTSHQSFYLEGIHQQELLMNENVDI